MSGFLLDTNCISELVRNEPEPKVVHWLEAADERFLYLSVLTLGEIRKGLATLVQGRKRSRLESWIDLDLKSRFAGRLLPIDEDIAERWGLIAAQARMKGNSLAVIDGLLTATALHHNLTIVTRNTSDFADTEVPVFNPWL